MKHAYLVVGPESCGNRLLAALLVRAGCVGSGSMAQPPLPVYEDPVVIVRSYPHGNEWPDLRQIVPALRDRGYLCRVLVTVRDAYATAESQHRGQHHSRELAAANIRRAYAEIFGQLAQLNVWYQLVTLESLVLHQAQAVRRLLEACDLPTGNLGGEIIVEGQAYTRIEDPNGKYYA